jgi:periodic tryptophan protein 2
MEVDILDAPDGIASTSAAAADAIVAYTRWGIAKRDYFSQQGAQVVCTTFHRRASMLVVGFSNGVFGLWEMPSFTNIHTLSISQEKIGAVAINPTGEWLAFGAQLLGQLLVWEWQSESYVLKQQGHYFDMNTLSFSQDGQNVATGGEDGKVKVWNARSGFCFVTFGEHSASVSGVDHGIVGWNSSSVRLGAVSKFPDIHFAYTSAVFEFGGRSEWRGRLCRISRQL